MRQIMNAGTHSAIVLQDLSGDLYHETLGDFLRDDHIVTTPTNGIFNKKIHYQKRLKKKRISAGVTERRFLRERKKIIRENGDPKNEHYLLVMERKVVKKNSFIPQKYRSDLVHTTLNKGTGDESIRFGFH